MANEVPKVRADLAGAGAGPARKRHTNRGGLPLVIDGRSVAPGEEFEADLAPDHEAFLVRAGFIDAHALFGGQPAVIAPGVADEEKR